MKKLTKGTIKIISNIAKKANYPGKITGENAQDIVKSLAENHTELLAQELERGYNHAVKQYEYFESEETRHFEENYQLITDNLDGVFSLLDIETDYPGLYPTFTLKRNGKTLSEYSTLGAIRQYNNFWSHLSAELKPVLEQLQKEGIEVYTYTCNSMNSRIDGDEINSLYWWDDKRKRVLNIQPSTWRNFKYNRDCFQLGVSYIPSSENGSGCGLSYESSDWGHRASEILKFRDFPTWVSHAQNYKSMEDFLKREKVLTFFKIESIHV